MRLLLGSGGFRTEQRIHFLTGQMREFFGNIHRLLFVPYALKDHDSYVKALQDKGIHAGYELDGMHRHADPIRAVEEAEAIFIGGGNSFRLLAELYQRDLLDVIRDRVHRGMLYMGVSAGSNMACPSIMTTNDMPITMPPSFAALGLVPFQINPHYFFGQVHVKQGDNFQEHFGETRDDRIREFHEMNETLVIGLWEGGILRVEGKELSLVGAPARLFRKDHPPEDVAAGARLDALLME